ncbi:hypothetical protein BDW59DRAFT_29463 [Aspergillus cavernicola]|uniref:Uncharacterized protein n=1 Tax=Aspergillus cavernicola TaxID=176166 RepID=A0ABR4IQJ2_9EURO
METSLLGTLTLPRKLSSTQEWSIIIISCRLRHSTPGSTLKAAILAESRYWMASFTPIINLSAGNPASAPTSYKLPPLLPKFGRVLMRNGDLWPELVIGFWCHRLRIVNSHRTKRRRPITSLFHDTFSKLSTISQDDQPRAPRNLHHAETCFYLVLNIEIGVNMVTGPGDNLPFI